MGLMEPGCTLEDFGRPVQPAAPNRLRCRARWCLSDICVKPCEKARVEACAWLIAISVVAEAIDIFGNFWLFFVCAK